MTFTKIGFNITEMNLTTLNITMPSSSQDFLETMVSTSHTITNDIIGFVILFTLAIIIYLAVSDKSENANFGFDNHKSLSIATGISCQIGAVMVCSELLYSIRPIAILLVIFMLIESIQIISEDRDAN